MHEMQIGIYLDTATKSNVCMYAQDTDRHILGYNNKKQMHIKVEYMHKDKRTKTTQNMTKLQNIDSKQTHIDKILHDEEI